MRIPDILDNSKIKVFKVLNYLLKTQEKADFASGFFNIGGYQLVRDSIGKVKEFRLLLGKEPEVPEPKEEILNVQEFFNQEIKKNLEEEEFTKEKKDSTDHLIDFLSRKEVKIRLYPNRFFHGKAYIFEDFAIIGSSNFTSAGLTGNTELNYVVKQDASIKELQKWFEKFWQESVDYKEEFLERLNESKFGRKEYSPYQIYMKTLYEYFREDFEDETKDIAKLSEVELTEFQEDAYKRAKRILQKYNGVLVADSVGTGKTFIGKKLLEDYAYHLREDALLICPASLKKMWDDELQKAHIKVQMRSMEELSQEDFPVEEFAKYKVVLVDESHNFRNRNERYDALFKLVASGERKKVILLTATPINNTLLDLYNQVSLIARGHEDYFRRAGIYDLKRYFLNAMKEDQVSDKLFNLLEEIAIRRTRHFIKENYPNATINGEPVRFPDRELETVNYNLEDVYEGIYDDAVEGIQRLHLTPYNLRFYKKERTKEDQEEIWRSEALTGIMKTLFLKRFESSIEAFRLSIRYQLEYLHKFTKYFEKGKVLSGVTFRKYLFNEEGEPPEDFEKDIIEIDLKEYKSDLIKQHVRNDQEVLSKLLEDAKRVTPAGDEKLKEFKDRLISLGEQKKKVLVFSYYKDTIDYISGEISNNRRIKELFERIETISGGTSPKHRNEIIADFAPKLYDKPEIVGTAKEVMLLLSTDVLSEGQNLQSCDTVINYDLHWNPTRMIQRSGRIDRLRSPFDIIYIQNFFPEEGLEKLLGIVDTLNKKIMQISETVGLDVSILGETISPKVFNALKRIKLKDKTVIDELERENELVSNEEFREELLRFFMKSSKEELEKIPLGVHSGLEKPPAKGIFFYFKTRDYHFLEYYDLLRKKIRDNRLEILRLVHCQPEIPRVVADYDIFKILPKVTDEVLKKAEESIALEVAPKKLEKYQRDVRDVVEEHFEEIEDSEKASLILAILSLPLRPYKRELIRLREKYQENKNFKELLESLFRMVRKYQLDVMLREQKEISSKAIQKEELKLICYDILS